MSDPAVSRWWIAACAAPDGELIIKAPIPGLITRLPVEPGQALAEGDTLVILEAMKMENELRAPAPASCMMCASSRATRWRWGRCW